MSFFRVLKPILSLRNCNLGPWTLTEKYGSNLNFFIVVLKFPILIIIEYPRIVIGVFKISLIVHLYLTCSLHVFQKLLCQHLKVGHHRLASETPFEWRFAGGPMVARHSMLAGFLTVVLKLSIFIIIEVF